MKHKMWSRLLSMVLAVMMITSIVPTSAFAEAASEIAASSQATSEVQVEEVPLPEDTTTEEPAAETPAQEPAAETPAEEPAGEPVPTAEPVAEPTAEPATESEQPAAEPTQAPAETAVPSEQPSAEPTAAPEGTETPEGTAVPSATPAPSETPVPSETPEATETPAATEEPEQGMSALTGEELVAALMQLDDESLVAALDTLTEEQIASVDALEAEKTEALFGRLETLFGESETEVQEPLDFNAMSAEELYDYLSSLTDDDKYFRALNALTAEKQEELWRYIDVVATGETETVTKDRGIVDYFHAAGLVEKTPASVYRMMMRAAPLQNLRGFESDGTAQTDGLEMHKFISEYNAETGEGELTLEAYVTGEEVMKTTSTPVDVILVLDQSSSMHKDIDGSITDYTVKNYTNYQAYRNGQKLYTKIEGEYKPVTITQKNETAINYTQYQNTWNWEYSDLNNNIYISFDNGQTHYKLNVSTSGDYYKKYNISYIDGNGITQDLVSDERDGRLSNNDKFDGATFYYASTTTVIYYYSVEGQEEKSSAGANGKPPYTLYVYETKDDINRMDALRYAAQNFVDSLRQDAKTSGVNHRVAVVGFGVGSYYANDYHKYQNTEILTLNNGNGIEYGNLTTLNYQNALVDCNNEIVDAALNNLESDGATMTNLGLEMAKKILAQNPVKEGEERKQVVILFTDGAPSEWSEYSTEVQNSAINEAKSLKDAGVTLYTIGVFDNANGTVNNQQGSPSPASWHSRTAPPTYNVDQLVSNQSNAGYVNKFLHILSSNYPNATSMGANKNSISQSLELIDKNNPNLGYESYYLSAGNAEALNSVFESIREAIGGATASLGVTDVLQDVMSEYVTLPTDVEKSDITVYTVDALAESDAGIVQWSTDPKPLNEAQIEVDAQSGIVHVSGFDYSENYVGTRSDGSYSGKKLIVKIPFVTDMVTYGGNNIPTNANTSGIYNSVGDTCYGNFEIPMVNVPVDYEIGAQSQTIYITNKADLTQLLVYPDKEKDDEFYKPDGVKNQFVDITYTLQQGEEVIGTLTIPAGTDMNANDAPIWTSVDGANLNPGNLDNCTPYTIFCTVTPSEAEQTGSVGDPAIETRYGPQAATVHVLKPVVTWQDTTKQYQAVVTPSTENYVKVEWKDSTAESVQGTVANVASGVQAPELSYVFSLADGDGKEWPQENKITEEMHVKVTVKIGTRDVTQYTTFKWQKDEECPQSCSDPNENNPKFQFRIHLGSGKLIITKTLTKLANNGSPVFDFKVTAEDGTVYYYHVDMTDGTLGAKKQVVEVTLPAGDYTVEELSNQNYDLTDVTGAISHNNGQVTIGGEPKTVNFTNAGKNTNIPTDGSGVVNNAEKTENGVVIWTTPEQLGAEHTDNITGPTSN